MGARRQEGFRSGDHNEALGSLLLKCVAFVADVPRQEDIGIDAIATLHQRGPNKMLIAENSFAVQFKSSTDRRIKLKEHEVRWLEKLEIPFFIGSVSKKGAILDLYATHSLSQAMTQIKLEEVILLLDNRDKGPRKTTAKCRHIGPPLLTWSTSDLANKDFAPLAYSVLKPYLEAEQRNIDYRAIRYIEPITWETNKPPKCQHGHSIAQSTLSNDDIQRVFISLTPPLRAVASWAISTKDRPAFELCLQMIDYMRRGGVESDPNRLYQYMLDNWDTFTQSPKHHYKPNE